MAGAGESVVVSQSTHVLPLEFNRRYPVIVRGQGVWVEDAAGKRYLDAMSGGSMAATLGHGRRDIVAAARAQAKRLAYVHNERLTNPAQERLAHELTGLAPDGFTRVRFVTGGAEANEMAMQIARTYHVERGQPRRWQVISPAQSYHGPTMATLALTGRPGLKRPFEPYMSTHLHIPPSTWRFDPTGEQALQALDKALDASGPETVSAYFCEPITAAALPSYSPPAHFWKGLAERRDRHGFLICFDEIVTGMGRTGHWFAAQGLRSSLTSSPPPKAWAQAMPPSGRCCAGSMSTTRSPAALGNSRWGIRGTVRRFRALSASPSSTCCGRSGWSSESTSAGRGCETSSPRR